MRCKSTRRAVLSGAAAIPAAAALTLPVVAANPDTVFAAIEAHKAGRAESDRLAAIVDNRPKSDDGRMEANEKLDDALDVLNVGQF